MGEGVKDRYEFALDTPNGGYYDQVVGMSQGIINKSFKTMFDNVEGIAQAFHNGKEKGVLNCTLDAPSILIMGNSSSTAEIYYQLRIKTGYADLPSGTRLKLADWVFSIQTPLKEVTITPTAQDTPATRKLKEEAVKNLEKTYNGFKPGDYRVQRIFCALAEARWYAPEGVWSTCGIDPVTKETIYFADWEKKNETNASDLLDLIRDWAKKQKKEHLSSLGVKFELEKELLNAPDPTFRPVSIFTQVYPYRSKQYPQGINGVGTYGKDGKMVPGDFNCFTYCENVDSAWQLYANAPLKEPRPLPGEPKLIQTSNLAQPASDGTEISGSFAMDYRVWLEFFLLPQLQELCQASQMHCGEADRKFTDKFRPSVYPNYAIGTPLAGMERRAANHSSFKFDKSGDLCYKWTQSSKVDGSPFPYKVKIMLVEFIPSWNVYTAESKSSVTVTWTPGSDHLMVNGVIWYYFTTRFASNSDMTQNRAEKTYTIQGTWNLKVLFTGPKDLVMKPQIPDLINGMLPPNQFKVEEVGETITSNVAGNAKECFERDLRAALTIGIGKVGTNIREKFETVGKFVFPGHGALKFSAPRLTRNGSLLSTADYAKPSGPDGTVSFPDPVNTSLEPPTNPIPATSSFPSEYTDTGKPKLHWTMDFKYDAQTKLGRLTFTATNESHNEPVALEYIKIKLVPPTGTARCLFNGPKWEKEDKSLLEQAASLFHLAADKISNLFSAHNETPKIEENNDVGPVEPKTSTSQEKSTTSSNATAEIGKETTPGKTSKPAIADDKPADSTGEKKVDSAGEKQPLLEDDDKPKKKPKKPVPTISDIGNVYMLAKSKNSRIDSDLEMKVKMNTRNLAVEATIERPELGGETQIFNVARHDSITIVLQGQIDGAGQWPIMVSESWPMQASDKAGSVMSISEDYKMVQMFADGREPDYFDISNRMEQLQQQKKP